MVFILFTPHAACCMHVNTSPARPDFRSLQDFGSLSFARSRRLAPYLGFPQIAIAFILGTWDSMQRTEACHGGEDRQGVVRNGTAPFVDRGAVRHRIA